MDNTTMELELQLGDIIRIINPVNDILNNQTFLIDYIDREKVFFINTDTLDRIKLSIDADGILGNGTITRIDILSRAESPSYAKQHGLLPGTWVNIYFGGDFPVILTGEITNLEKDMIEIQTPEKDTLYINFDYKGIPEDLPIDNIEIRVKPSQPLSRIEEEEEAEEEKPFLEQDIDFPELVNEPTMVKAKEIQIQVPMDNIKNQLREFIVRADQIVFGDEELGPIKQFIDVSPKTQKYSIEVQTADLLDDLLSTIPDAQRTPRVLNNIHLVIERFKQLRELYSVFDKYGNVERSLKKTSTYKPLHQWLQNFNINLYWILPVVKNIKKMYDVEQDEENNDIVHLNINTQLLQMTDILQNYKANTLSNDNNTYSVLYSELDPFFKPFAYIDDEHMDDVLIEKAVQTNLTTIINNLEDMYSSVFHNNSVRNKRFVISKYNLGQTKLDTLESTGGRMTTVRVPITNNDLMSITSFLTLPEPTIRFSKINLPGTDILSKVNLNQIFLNYWQLLKTKTNVESILIDSLETNLTFDENTFVSGVRNYMLNLPKEEFKTYANRLEIYNQFTNQIVPKIRVIFQLMKKYIVGKLSIVHVLSYLEPFLIYTDDLTFKQYQQITYFIDQKVSAYNKNLVELSRVFKSLSFLKSANLNAATAFSIVRIIDDDLTHDVLQNGYHIDNAYSQFTNSEILQKMTVTDCSRLYTSAIAYQNLRLMYPKDISKLFDVEVKQNETKMKETAQEKKCDNIVIAKMYSSMQQLESDNDIIAYFDKKYDATNYGVMEDMNGYAKQVTTLSPEELRDYIIQDQMKKNRLPEKEAAYVADTLIDGNKRVTDGQYAILYKGYHENQKDEKEQYDYYVRKHNKWVLDETVANSINLNDPSIFCNLQEKCMYVPNAKVDANTCESNKANELRLQNALLNNVLNEFDSKYKQSKKDFEKEIKTQYEYFISIMPFISKIETNHMLKYNNEKYHLGLSVENEEHVDIIVSPFAKLLDMILSQSDFSKKQHDLVRFVDKFTRTSIPGTAETSHWLYCAKTGVPLLPAFKKELADAFLISSYDYQVQLELVQTHIGQLSDDGNWWTDKHTGWPICPGNFDVEEGYDDGFKVVTRSVLEEDAGNKISAQLNQPETKFITLEAVIVNNIVNALSIAMGVNIQPQKEFIVNCVLQILSTTLESEEDYKEKIKTAAQKGKNILSYRDLYNTSILFYTLGAYLIAIQTTIPPLKTRKTHPGCVRSFSGYPFEGAGDLSSLTYLSCVTHDLRSSAEPWNVLKKTNVDKIQTRIKSVIDQFMIPLPEVQRKFEEKTQYLLTAPPHEIPQEHDIANWIDFLPPLVPFHIKNLHTVSEEFRKQLVSELRSGSIEQREKCLVIESKIIQFSLAIQEKIQAVVRSHRALLHTANNEPYLENSCCDSSDKESTHHYFTTQSPDILEYNHIVQKLANMLEDIKANTQSPMLFSNINTKNIYPSISTTFDEKTIYLAFIFYCKFKSLLPIPEQLLGVCTGKPENHPIHPTDTIERMIQKLKEDGKHYTNQQFIRLIQLVSRENIVHMDLQTPIVSSVTKLEALLSYIRDENHKKDLVDQAFATLMVNSIDTFTTATQTTTPAIKDLNNYLITENEDMARRLIQFVENNSGTSISKKAIRQFTNTIHKLDVWEYPENTRNRAMKISNDEMYTITNFNKNFVYNFINVFPTIILNEVNYDQTNIPPYYGFSKNHQLKLQKEIAHYFEKFKPFYKSPVLQKILTTIQKHGLHLIQLSEQTPCFSNIQQKDGILKGVIDEDTSRYLFQYYVLTALVGYLSLTDDKNMIVTSTRNKQNKDEIYTTQSIEDDEILVDTVVNPRYYTNTNVIAGNRRVLKEKTAELLVAFMDIYDMERQIIDITYQEIQDRIFKLKEKEKDLITDRLKNLTDEARDLDTVFKILKQGNYSKGSEKGLTMYDKDFYEEEQELRDEMNLTEQKMREKVEEELDNEEYDMRNMHENFYDGDPYGEEHEYDGEES